MSVGFYLEREIGERERFLLIMYFVRFMSREALRNFHDARILEFLIQAEELLSYSYPYPKKRSLSPIFQQLRVRLTLFRKKEPRISAKSLFDGNTGGDQQVCMDKADLIDPIVITRLRC